MACSRCGRQSAASARFCEECGAPLGAACAACGSVLQPTAKFCPDCGHPRALPAAAAVPAPAEAPPAIAPAPTPDGERRQLTVMFCDLVGSTPLSKRIDAEDLRDTVRAYQECAAAVTEALEGRIAQYLGDGLLVYFGYPQAHEDDAIRAVRAGLRILEELPALNAKLAARVPALREHPLEVRIGVHTGQVVVGAMGGGAQRETLALGDTVNIAGRLMSVTDPGWLVISGATQRLVRGAFLLEDLGEKALKGLDDPLPAFRVLRATGVQSRLALAAGADLSPLVGREQELALLLDRWEQVCEGRGKAVLLSGEAGIGKSRLVLALRERLADQPHTWLEGHSSPYHQNSALHSVSELLKQALLFGADDTPAEQALRLERALGQAGLSVPEVFPLLAALLDVPLPEGMTPPVLSPEARRRKTLEALCAWLLSLAEHQPLVLVAEDLQWSDPSTLELLGMQLEQVRAAPILLLFTHRAGFEPSWLSRGQALQLPLHALSRKHMEALVSHAAGGRSLPPPVLDEIVAKTDGVPLFVEELTRSVLESNLLRESERGYERTDPLPAFAVPATLQDSLMARLDRLGAAKELAQLGAVLGREFSHELLAAVSPLAPEELEAGLRELGGADLLHRRGLPPRASYVFKHALIQETAYQSLLKKTRQQLHARVAQTLAQGFPERAAAEPELVARHFEEAGRGEPAIDWYHRAGERAAERSANAEAIHHLTRALGLVEALPEGEERLSRELALRISLGAPLAAARGFGSPEVERLYLRARELGARAGAGPEYGEALSGLSVVYSARAQLDASCQLSQEILRVAEAAGDPNLLAAGHYQLTIARYLKGEPTRSLEHARRVFAIDAGGESASLAGSMFGADDLRVVSRLWGAWAAWLHGLSDTAVELIREALALARESSNPFSIAYALAWGSAVHQMRREREPAALLADEAVAVAQEQGFPIPLGCGKVVGLWARTLPGLGRSEQDALMAEIQQALIGLGETGVQATVPQILGGMAEVRLTFERSDEAIALADAALGVSAATGQPYWDAELLRIKGEALLRRDGSAAAEGEALLRRAVEIAHGQGARSLELRAAMALARLLRERGESREVRSLLSGVYGSFREGFETADLRDARALLDELGSA